MNDRQTVSTLNAPEAMQAMQFVIDLFTKDKVTPPIKNLVTESSLTNFLQGNVAFMQNGPWQVVNVRKAKFDWDVIPFPAGAAGQHAAGVRVELRDSVRGQGRPSSTSRGSC